MDDNSQDTLRRIEQNDTGLRDLCIGYFDLDGGFISNDAGDYSRLGAAIGKNNHLKTLNVFLVLTTKTRSWIWQILNSLMALNEIHLSVTWNLSAITKLSLEE